MPIPCPRCQHPITPGATSCPGCGTSLLREVSPGGTEPTCAVHPTLLSLAICDRCGTFACARCLRLSSRKEGVCERCLAREPGLPMPWDQREELGTLKAFWRTVVNVMLRPDAFSTARPEGSAGSSLLFALLCSLPPSFMTGLTYLGLFTVLPPLIPTQTRSAEEIPVWVGLGTFIFCVLLGPPMSLALTVVGAGIDHLVLRIGGVTRGFQVTLRANALSQAPWVLGLVPLLGVQVAPIWALVARAFAYRGLHQTTWGVALTGALLAPFFTCLLCGGGYVAMLMYTLNNLNR
ncbi:zinc ribbon domain-containing protein [Archangium sp.]|uniref:zinc ribbon domain-containing protein n=1 Tax=Archangium sp. TaxID=1872627 RepID=UPI002D75F10D|nr:zinc ribbon domain-containing protein [Archangium sp.]HYO59580.1 zinc ribbon domain-containing protein [Archangium sp.]